MQGIILVNEYFRAKFEDDEGKEDFEWEERPRVILCERIQHVFDYTGNDYPEGAVINTTNGNYYVQEDVQDVFDKINKAHHEYWYSVNASVHHNV